MYNLILKRYINKILLFIIFSLSFILMGCGGAGTSGVANFSTMAVFSDGAGVATGTDADGREAIIILDSVVAEVAYANNNPDTSTSPLSDPTKFPIISQSNGYNIRQGADTTDLGATFNFLIAEKIGTGKPSVVYFWNNQTNAIGSYSYKLVNLPIGSFNYNGIYSAGSRSSDFSEIGNLSITANFQNDTFTINGQSSNTSLTGTGFIDKSNGRISSGNLSFISPHGTNYSATTIGRFGGNNALTASGVFYTNDNNPDYAGAYSSDR